MNERNVVALTEAIEAIGDGVHRAILRRPSMTHQEVSRMVAERLTARGVLVPNALTEDEVMLIPTHSDDGIDFRPFDEVASDVRAELEEIARGGPA